METRKSVTLSEYESIIECEVSDRLAYLMVRSCAHHVNIIDWIIIDARTSLVQDIFI